MSQPPDKSTWTDGGPSDGGEEDKSFAYRQSRKAFIAACEKAGADVIARVHPARAPDGGPLFLDAATFGPRLAKAGVVVAAETAPGAAVLLALLAGKAETRLPEGVRLVLVHGADPAAFAWNNNRHSDAKWGAAMLKAVMTEDLRAAKKLTLAGLGRLPELAAPAGTSLSVVPVVPGGTARAAVEKLIAAAGE
jgi:hypothetical protein